MKVNVIELSPYRTTVYMPMESEKITSDIAHSRGLVRIFWEDYDGRNFQDFSIPTDGSIEIEAA